jgi:hypothetical protein
MTSAFGFLLHNGKSTPTIRLGVPKTITSSKKGSVPYNIVAGALYLPLSILLLSITYHYLGTSPLAQKKEL